MTSAYLLILTLFVGGLIGTFATLLALEGQRRRAAEAERYKKIILRMIPQLQQHYTAEYIYWDLIQPEKADLTQ